MATELRRVDEAAVEAAIGALARALGADAVITSPDELAEYRDPYDYKGSDELHRRRGRDAAHGRGGPGDRSHRQRAPGPAVDLRAGAQQLLRRAGAAGPRLDPGEHARDEPRARGRRGARLRGRRAGRALLRSLRPPRRRRARPVAVDPRHRLGQRRRQHARVRARLHALRRAPGDRCGLEVVLASGELAAHRHGRDDEQPAPGTRTAVVRALRTRASSSSPTSASSPRWASG